MFKTTRRLSLLIGFLASSSVSALDFNVDSTTDEVDASPGDGVCATSSGACSLRAAVQEANASAGADVINLLSNTYVLTLGSKDENACAEGDLDVTDDVKIVGAGNTLTIIDGNATDRIFDVPNGASLELQDLTIQNGLLSGSYGDNGAGARLLGPGTLSISAVRFLNNTAFSGGAVYCRGTAHLNIADSLFDGNLSNSTDGSGGAGSGGALAALQRCGVTISNTTFSNNTGKGYGGAIQMESGELLITGSSFDNNKSQVAVDTYWDDGGAISIFHGNRTVIVDSSFTGNTASDAGAIASRSPAYIFNSSFTGNTAMSNIGGALSMSDAYLYGLVVDSNIGGGANLYQSKVYNSLFINNTADSTKQIIGGGLSGSYLEIRNSAFINNTAYSPTSYSAGGGLALYTEALVENTTVSGNVSNNGGGIYLSEANGGNVYTLTHVTVTGNESINTSLAANIASYSTGITATLGNSIVSNPIGGPDCVGQIVTAGGNIASDSSCSLSTQDSVADPQLAALDTTDYVHPFNTGSLAIDFGVAGLCLPTDQRMLFRSDAACDAGAYEQGATSPVSASVIGIAETYTEMPEFGSASFTLTRSGSSEGEVSAVITTVSDTAWASEDYTALTQVVTWADGDMADKIIQVTLTEDQAIEDDEEFVLHLASVAGNGTIDSTHQDSRVHIFDNDGDHGRLSIDSAYTKWENKGTLTITVSRLYGSSKDYSVDYRTVDSTAFSGADYTGVSGTLYWADGDAAPKTITIDMLDDALVEGAEQFDVELFNHTRPEFGVYTDTSTVTIEDDESWAFFELNASTYSVAENAGSLSVTVTRQGLTNELTSIYISSSSFSGYTADSFSDFTPVSQRLNFAIGETSKTVSIPIIDDTLAEGSETFRVYLSSPASNGKLGETTQGVVTINDNDSSGGSTSTTNNGSTTTQPSGGGGGGSLGLFTLLMLLASRLLLTQGRTQREI